MTSQQFTIREATLADLDVILHHRKRMFVEMGYPDDEAMAESGNSSREYFSQAITAGMYRGWIAVGNSGAIIGGGGIVLSRKPSHPRHPQLLRADILNVYTEPEQRRKGVARALMSTMIDWCETNGFAWVTLHASKDGRPLYEKLGFKPTSEMRLELPHQIGNRKSPK
jgi:GNAT superfamily N-acetyltransferase